MSCFIKGNDYSGPAQYFHAIDQQVRIALDKETNVYVHKPDAKGTLITWQKGHGEVFRWKSPL